MAWRKRVPVAEVADTGTLHAGFSYSFTDKVTSFLFYAMIMNYVPEKRII